MKYNIFKVAFSIFYLAAEGKNKRYLRHLLEQMQMKPLDICKTCVKIFAKNKIKNVTV